ncbi:hypothetical protein F2Q69_00022602 [Brassica cretica]|uniref:Uncharacterized protein n=1 Tax=Brassica cretica TaxID=69181 RepID=A0A8S9QCS6_BRACR|nr:hypothetical protein F2Q69_00022602 [Brassica cretica]
MVATLILVRDEKEDLHDPEGHMRNAAGTCPTIPEATRKINYYSHQILQAWNVQSSKEYATHRSTTTLVRRLIFCQPSSTQTLVSSTDTRSPPLTEDTLPSIDYFHPTSINSSVRTSIDTEP